MNRFDWLQIIIFVAALVALAKPLAGYIAAALEDSSPAQNRIFGACERFLYRLCGINPSEQMTWRTYTWALLAFNFAGMLLLLFIELLQHRLPLNPNKMGAVDFWLAFNTAASFTTNTNWQAYSGETTMSYLTQMLGLCSHNFLSAATGIAVFAAMARGLIGKQVNTLGNYWADMTRITLRILLPLSIILALALAWQGVPQTLKSNVPVTTIEGAQQTLPLGPVASQIAIKQLGTNGGGFYNANSAHPYENPTPLTNLLEMISMFLISAALVLAYGKMTGNRNQGRTLFAVMFAMFAVGLAVSLWSEYSSIGAAGGAAVMEGKETRFGITNSVLWSVVTTDTSTGAVNCMHSSLSPLSGGVAMFNIMLGELIFGGVGEGMYSMLLFVLLTVFLCGLMVGRTPEYLGKKIEKREIQMAIVGTLAPGAVILIGSALTCAVPSALACLSAKGPHGLSEILYAWTSSTGNNGSAFAGLNANTNFFNIGLALAMLAGRFAVIVPCLAIAGSMGVKQSCPPSAGTLPTDTPTFGVLLVGVILIVAGLTFFPALALGPGIEHLLMLKGVAF
jgi:K+-transporting ATPase ATPase A chain